LAADYPFTQVFSLETSSSFSLSPRHYAWFHILFFKEWTVEEALGTSSNLTILPIITL